MRTGVYVGIFLSFAMMAWVIVANRMPLLERFALIRNVMAVGLLGVIASIPILRFWRWPGNLLASSLVGWLIFSVTYRVLCLVFVRLDQRVSAVQVFMLGAVLYLMVVTLSWIGTIIRRARASNATHPNHPVS